MAPQPPSVQVSNIESALALHLTLTASCPQAHLLSAGYWSLSFGPRQLSVLLVSSIAHLGSVPTPEPEQSCYKRNLTYVAGFLPFVREHVLHVVPGSWCGVATAHLSRITSHHNLFLAFCTPALQQALTLFMAHFLYICVSPWTVIFFQLCLLTPAPPYPSYFTWSLLPPRALS